MPIAEYLRLTAGSPARVVADRPASYGQTRPDAMAILASARRRLPALPPVRLSGHRLARASAAAGIIGADRRERTEADLRATGETGGKPNPRLSPSSPRRTADPPSRAAQPSLSPRMFGCRPAPGAHRAGDRVTHRTGTRWHERQPSDRRRTRRSRAAQPACGPPVRAACAGWPAPAYRDSMTSA